MNEHHMIPQFLSGAGLRTGTPLAPEPKSATAAGLRMASYGSRSRRQTFEGRPLPAVGVRPASASPRSPRPVPYPRVCLPGARALGRLPPVLCGSRLFSRLM